MPVGFGSRSVEVVTSPNDLPRTIGELRASGHIERGVKEEIRENLLALSLIHI